MDTLQDTEESEKQYVLNESTELSWGFEPIIFKYTYEFIMMNLSL